jgi:hypothetical protein
LAVCFPRTGEGREEAVVAPGSIWGHIFENPDWVFKDDRHEPRGTSDGSGAWLVHTLTLFLHLTGQSAPAGVSPIP